ncbi:hypothetical protein [Cellulosilyticum sp. I15G10I2]|uniref:hypothetical protein n=1 Tax=Cellulosilyticum sp. I15G10I2 TaxID=1892843 RepID=UPI00085BF496|nr:hypothetical protein [Cellulosilyticum sp. I15G10I2]
MDIKWSYYLIVLIYILVSILKVINNTLAVDFKKLNKNTIQLTAIKKDFFTTVSCICIVVTIFINSAALLGGKTINKASILITLLVVGFTILNSYLKLFISPENESILLLGYLLKKDDVETIRTKERKGYTSFDITFTKEIDSYNYIKLLVFGENRKKFEEILTKLIKENG